MKHYFKYSLINILMLNVVLVVKDDLKLLYSNQYNMYKFHLIYFECIKHRITVIIWNLSKYNTISLNFHYLFRPRSRCPILK